MIVLSAIKKMARIVLKKALASLLVVAFLLNNTIGWADDSLAAKLRTTMDGFKDRFLAGEILASHRAVNECILQAFEDGNAVRTKLMLDLNKSDFYKDGMFFKKAELAYVPNLLKKTGQFAHVGLGQAAGLPTIYIDSKFYYSEDMRLHEIDEIVQWELLRMKLGAILKGDPDGIQPSEMRDWIKEHFDTPDEALKDTEYEELAPELTSAALAKKFHGRSHKLPRRLLEEGLGAFDFSTMLALYEEAKTEKDVTIGATIEKNDSVPMDEGRKDEGRLGDPQTSKPAPADSEAITSSENTPDKSWTKSLLPLLFIGILACAGCGPGSGVFSSEGAWFVYGAALYITVWSIVYKFIFSKRSPRARILNVMYDEISRSLENINISRRDIVYLVSHLAKLESARELVGLFAWKQRELIRKFIRSGAIWTGMLQALRDKSGAVKAQSSTAPVSSVSEGDFDISGSGSRVMTRAEHMALHIDGDFRRIIDSIAHEIGLNKNADKDENGDWKLKEYAEKQKAYGRSTAIKTMYGAIWIERKSALVIMDSRFKKDHAGRGRFAVYARNWWKVKHEISEVENWKKFAKKTKIRTKDGSERYICTLEETREGKLGQRLRAYINGSDESISKRLLRSRKEEINDLVLRFHEEAVRKEREYANKAAWIIYKDIEQGAGYLSKKHVLYQHGVNLEDLFSNYDPEFEVFIISDRAMDVIDKIEGVTGRTVAFNSKGFVFIRKSKMDAAKNGDKDALSAMRREHGHKDPEMDEVSGEVIKISPEQQGDTDFFIASKVTVPEDETAAAKRAPDARIDILTPLPRSVQRLLARRSWLDEHSDTLKEIYDIVGEASAPSVFISIDFMTCNENLTRDNAATILPILKDIAMAAGETSAPNVFESIGWMEYYDTLTATNAESVLRGLVKPLGEIRKAAGEASAPSVFESIKWMTCHKALRATNAETILPMLKDITIAVGETFAPDAFRSIELMAFRKVFTAENAATILPILESTVTAAGEASAPSLFGSIAWMTFHQTLTQANAETILLILKDIATIADEISATSVFGRIYWFSYFGGIDQNVIRNISNRIAANAPNIDEIPPMPEKLSNVATAIFSRDLPKEIGLIFINDMDDIPLDKRAAKLCYNAGLSKIPLASYMAAEPIEIPPDKKAIGHWIVVGGKLSMCIGEQVRNIISSSEEKGLVITTLLPAISTSFNKFGLPGKLTYDESSKTLSAEGYNAWNFTFPDDRKITVITDGEERVLNNGTVEGGSVTFNFVTQEEGMIGFLEHYGLLPVPLDVFGDVDNAANIPSGSSFGCLETIQGNKGLMENALDRHRGISVADVAKHRLKDAIIADIDALNFETNIIRDRDAVDREIAILQQGLREGLFDPSRMGDAYIPRSLNTSECSQFKLGRLTLTFLKIEQEFTEAQEAMPKFHDKYLFTIKNEDDKVIGHGSCSKGAGRYAVITDQVSFRYSIHYRNPEYDFTGNGYGSEAVPLIVAVLMNGGIFEGTINKIGCSVGNMFDFFQPDPDRIDAIEPILSEIGFVDNVLDINRYATRTTYREFKILKDLGVLVKIRGKNRYRFSDLMIGNGEDDSYTANLINVVNEIPYKLHRRREAQPLMNGSIPKKRIPMVRNLIKLHVMNYLHMQIKEVSPQKESYVIKLWEGYGNQETQKNLMQGIERLTNGKPYQVEFEKDLNKLVQFACDTKDNAKVVTILPRNKLEEAGIDISVLEQGEKKAGIIYINLDNELKTTQLGPLEGLVAIGEAYLNGDERSFYRLYRLLAKRTKYEYKTLDELKQNPAFFIEKLHFNLRPITAHNIAELQEINARIAELLQSA